MAKRTKKYQVIPTSALRVCWFQKDAQAANIPQHPHAYRICEKSMKDLVYSVDREFTFLKYVKRPSFLSRFWIFPRWGEWEGSFLRQELPTSRWTKPLEDGFEF